MSVRVVAPTGACDVAKSISACDTKIMKNLKCIKEIIERVD